MKNTSLLFLLLVCSGTVLEGQSSPKALIHEVNRKFAQVRDYSADLNMRFNIPSVTLEPVSGKVFYKAPDKFRIKATGILFMPRQNPYFALQSVRDTNAFTAVLSGQEQIGAVKTSVINVIPNDNAGDLILARLWVDPVRHLILKSQLTTRSSGVLTAEQFYGTQQSKGLPDRIAFSMDIARFKVPKTLAVDLNAKGKSQKLPEKGLAVIELTFSAYKLNQKLPDSVFQEASGK